MAPIEAKEGIGWVSAIVGFFVAIYRYPIIETGTTKLSQLIGQLIIADTASLPATYIRGINKTQLLAS
ncbi:MAG: hypothetical protein WC932_05035 [archaeon]|jgi:hypothetical protein